MRATFPPYPFFHPVVTTNKVESFDRGKWKHFWPFECYDYDAQGERLTAGNMFGVATAHAPNIKEARRRVYNKTLQSIQAEQLQYRTDVGANGEMRVFKSLPS